MKTKITSSLVVCIAAAAFTAGALVLNDDGSNNPAPVAAGSAPSAGQGYARQPGATGGAAAGSAAPIVLEVRDFAFGAVTAQPGGSVVVQNRDAVAHTVTADGGRFDSGRVNPRGTAAITAPAAPGSYRFTCLIHPQMSGTLVVR